MILRDRYELTPIASGGQGQLFKARDRRIEGKTWLAKRLPLDGADPRGHPEVKALLLGLSGLPRLAEAFSDGSSIWVVRDYVEGVPLDELRALQAGRLTRDSIETLAAGMAKVLADLHRAGMVAVDVKPANFVRTVDGRIMLVDPGSATPIGTRLTLATGTQGFVAPEVATGASLTPAVDVFGLAETITWLIAGSTVAPDSGTELRARIGLLGIRAASAVEQALHADAATRPTLDALIDAIRAPSLDNCAQCGKPVAVGRSFCGSCGAPISSGSIAVAPARPAPSGPPLRLPTEYRRPRTLAAAIERRVSTGAGMSLELARLWHLAERLSLSDGFDSLIAVDQANIDTYDHQRTAALRILREFRGSGVLADEVGLGKTIEAGIVLSELMARDLASRVLVLSPPHLTSKWGLELATKFNDPAFVVCTGPGNWGAPKLVASHLQAVRQWFAGGDRHVPDPARMIGKNPYACVCACRCGRTASKAWARCDECTRLGERRLRNDLPEYDVVIVDEAHNAYRTDGSLKRLGELISGLRRRYLLLLTATPVRHDIRELYSLISLVRPGEFKSLRDFEARIADPLQADSSRQAAIGRINNVLSHVMVRQRRREIQIPWPAKQVYRQVVPLDPNDKRLRDGALEIARTSHGIRRRDLAMAAYSSPQAAASRLREPPPYGGAKLRQLERVLGTRGGERVIVFCSSRETMDAVHSVVAPSGRASLVYQGDRVKKLEIVRRFRDTPGSVLIADKSLSEGSDLQFARVLIVFDVPWNPFELEQMVGRVYRIGQANTVEIHPLVSDDGADLALWDLYENSLKMFDRQVGELDAILSELSDDFDFVHQVSMAVTSPGGSAEVLRQFDAMRSAIEDALADLRAEERFLEEMGLL